MPSKKIRLKIELRSNINQRPTDVEERKLREQKFTMYRNIQKNRSTKQNLYVSKDGSFFKKAQVEWK